MVKLILAGIPAAILGWILNSSEPPESFGAVWDVFCSWAIGAEPWAAGIALLVPGTTLLWLTMMSVYRRISTNHVGPTLSTPVLSLVGLASVAALSAYLGLAFAAQYGSLIAVVPFAVCATLLNRLVRAYPAALGVYSSATSPCAEAGPTGAISIAVPR